ncbi:PREDICTED: iron-responsive element-binding protein 2-like, partial [Thamnophis sirtalis]|uniref:Iron-responsive element-binding protein 2-like n=1 Tax=Thamnophis sirtalis TaxID=35019 RepID=A0A6I9X247_9SAUR
MALREKFEDTTRIQRAEAELQATRQQGKPVAEYIREFRHLVSKIIHINLGSITPYVSGPKRAQDRVAVTNMKSDFQACLSEKVGFRGFQIPAEKQCRIVPVEYEGNEYQLAHGSVVIAAVISCTNNCNPSAMLGAGLLAKKASEAGLTVKPYIRTSLSPGSGMVTHYLSSSGVLPYLNKLG